MNAIPKVVRIEHENRIYNTIVSGERGLTADELFILSIRTLRPPARVRRIRCVALSQERPRHGDFWPDIARGHFIVLHRASLILGGTGLEIGEAESFERMEAGATPGIDCPHIIATFYLHNCRLAEIVYNAIHERLIDGACGVVSFIKPKPWATRSIDGIVTEVRLGMLEDSCFPSARILKTWEESRQQSGHCGKSRRGAGYHI